jgi:hypothetical protein
MANDSQRDKARAIFGKTFFENSKALPNPKNAAAALQKRANDRPIPTYKVGGAVKKPTPPQPTAADREADRKRREEYAKMKVTKEQAAAIARGNRAADIEGGRYKDGGKANAGAKRAMKAEQDFTGLMRDAAARAAAKGTPVMKDGGATNEYTAKRVMSRIKAGNFKDGGRAESMRDRRMKDIEKDFKIALAKGKNEDLAKAKYEQRKADAADDYAKRTKADRTETRAAEKAAERTLTKVRKYGAPKAVTTEAPEAKVMDSMSAMAAPKMDSSIGAKPSAKTPAKTPAKAPKRVAAPARAATPTAAPAPAPARTAAPASNNRTALAGFAAPALLARNAFGDATAARLKKEAAERTAKAARDKAAAENRYQGRGRIAVQAPRPIQPLPKKVATTSTTKPITAEERKKRDAAYLSTQLAKGGKVEKFAAGGAGKVRKGMMKGK